VAQPTSSPRGTVDGCAQRSLSELLQQLTDQTTRLAQKEIELAKAEMAVKGKRIGMGAGAFSFAGLLALLALGALTAAAILGLATGMEGWLAALIVAAVYLLIAGAMALVGRRRSRPGRHRCRSRPWRA
jgi:Putative Actinobacterial Holin-X, holin superfamily III